MWIILTKNQKAWVDYIDADLSSYKWYYHINHKGGTGYAARCVGGRKIKQTIFMHNVIADRMGLSHSNRNTIDHVDQNKLNNSRLNLRPTDNLSQQQINVAPTKLNTSGYKGVSFHVSHNKFRATIMINGKHCHLGYFNTPEEAALVYNQKALENWGERAWLNSL